MTDDPSALDHGPGPGKDVPNVDGPVALPVGDGPTGAAARVPPAGGATASNARQDFITHDIWIAAADVAVGRLNAIVQDRVACAILAERERAAKVAEGFVAYTWRGHEGENSLSGMFARGNQHAAGKIAAAIRSGAKV